MSHLLIDTNRNAVPIRLFKSNFMEFFTHISPVTIFHGIHHAQPQVKTRLVMPLPVSIPLAAVFFGLFYLACVMLFKSPEWVAPLMAGFLIGYLAYDLTHYATHHFPMRRGYGKFLKRYHMQHHYKDPGTRFGVSSPAWD